MILERNHSAHTQDALTKCRWLPTGAIGVLLLLVSANAMAGDDLNKNRTNAVRVFRSQHLILHTDLERPKAKKVLNQLTNKLQDLSTYWSRSVSDPIRCYVVDNLDNWTETELDDSYAPEVIQRVGGFATRHPSGAKMYASSDLDVALHEIVHAYCLEAFPNSGPDWYKEGMACMFANSRNGLTGIQVNSEVIEYLRNTEHRTARSIYESREFTSPIAKIIQAAVDRNNQKKKPAADELSSDNRAFFTKSSNSPTEQKLIDKANASYRWSWALCHFLENNENYRKQFRALGLAYLSGSNPRFDQVFSTNAEQLESEFLHFTRRLAAGYQVELCSWNWDGAIKSITTDSTIARVAARRGLQSTKLRVMKGSQYSIKADGHWSIDATGPSFSATGNKDGAGRLTAAVLDKTAMGERIDLSPEGTFIANESGILFFRCRDHWNEIGDNTGCIRVQIREMPTQDPNSKATR